MELRGEIMSDLYVLQEYYKQYLRKIRGNSLATIKHYLGALDTISDYLAKQQKIEKTIYEITDLTNLEIIKEALYNDPEFIDKDERGHRMYSAGLNNYCRFAAGDNFVEIQKLISLMDIAVPRNNQTSYIIEKYKRSSILKTQIIESVGYLCEINPQHQTFISAATNHPYMEGHHAIPMKMQEQFSNSLDVYANIICLCPICHRQLHYGLCDDKIDMLKKIHYTRSERLFHSGLKVSQSEFIALAI
jgi:5-methylcytosine-specific restriction protein A